MKFEAYWEKYLNEDILEIFEETCDIYSKELSSEVLDEYDVSESILLTRDYLLDAKRFEDLIQFIALIKENQAQLYNDNFQYLDDFLIDYYCFHQDKEKVIAAFSNFMEDPIHDFDKYEQNLRKLLFYGYPELAIKAVFKNFESIYTSEELVPWAANEIAITAFFNTLGDLYQRDQNSVVFINDDFLNSLSISDLDLEEKYLSVLEKGMQSSHLPEDAVNQFQIDSEYFKVTLMIHFLKYMHKRNLSFGLSRIIWSEMMSFWDKKNNKNLKSNIYFKTKTKDFEKYLIQITGNYFVDNSQLMIAVLWGSNYVYDFLYSVDLIDQKNYENAIMVSKNLKTKVIETLSENLWNYNFVHLWQKPDSISESEFEKEKNLFVESLYFKKPIAINKPAEKNEEEWLTELTKTNKPKEERKSKPLNYVTPTYDENNKQIPAKSESKVGRNDPCPCGSGKKYKKCCG